jgi:hypothetical protein
MDEGQELMALSSILAEGRKCPYDAPFWPKCKSGATWVVMEFEVHLWVEVSVWTSVTGKREEV